jgi:hypothetical protein
MTEKGAPWETGARFFVYAQLSFAEEMGLSP